jgi:rare lipoprotein A
MGGCSKKGIDCSCFVRKIYEDLFYYDVNNLPRTVKGLATMEKGEFISKNDLQPSDLVIFQQPPPWYPHHVGIFIGDNEFIHASKSKGVIISRIDDPYHWEKYYSKSLRLLTEKDKQKIVERRGFLGNSKGTDEVVDNDIKRIEYGKASYYSDKFHGRKTACGDRYNRNQLTAAHKELPCGSVCRITHLGNGKSLKVVINDRGPFIKGRIIDLSHRAMKQLDGISAGIIEVKLELL